MNENEGYDFQGWEDPTPDYDVWEQNEVAQDERLERQAEEEAAQSVREVARQELLDYVHHVRNSLDRVCSWLLDGNTVKAYLEAKKAQDYLRHVEENAGRLS